MLFFINKINSLIFIFESAFKISGSKKNFKPLVYCETTQEILDTCKENKYKRSLWLESNSFPITWKIFDLKPQCQNRSERYGKCTRRCERSLIRSNQLLLDSIKVNNNNNTYKTK